MTGPDDRIEGASEPPSDNPSGNDKTIIRPRGSGAVATWPGDSAVAAELAEPETGSLDDIELEVAADPAEDLELQDGQPPRQNGLPDTSEVCADMENSADTDTETGPAEMPAIPVQQQFATLLADLEARLEGHPGGHDLLSVLRMLEGETAPSMRKEPTSGDTEGHQPGPPPRIGKSRRFSEDIVRFGQDPSSEFATSTIERVLRDGKGGLVLIERFLGLLGPNGALPSALTDEAIMRGLRGDESFPRFLDVFNNRFIQLFFRAWADARPIVQHDRPDDDRYLSYLGSTIGIGTPFFRDLDTLDDRLKLHYAGLMSAKSKSASRLQALISGTFGVRVQVEQFVGTWLQLDPDDQLSLGGFGPGGAGCLGRDTIVGAKVYSVSDKIRIRIFTQDLDQYRKFLPPTRTKPNPWTEKLFDLIDFYLGLETEYEIELALPKRCASAILMDTAGSATLGHIGWLKPRSPPAPPEQDQDDDELLTDTRYRPVRRHTAIHQ